MGMVVNNNIPALFSFNAVTKTGNALQKSIQKLSTGLRINSAADDAAGLAISEKMRAQIRGLDRAVSNSQDGISMIQTAEGALNETHSILQRMRELSVQSANDTLTQQDRGYIQLEIDQLREEITRIGNTTQFNKKKLLNGDAAVLWSSDNLNTKAIINGGLRQVDQFGQKKALEGNYKIRIKAEAGQGEVQKSDIFRVKHNTSSADVASAGWKVTRNGKSFSANQPVQDLPAGKYKVEIGAGAAASVTEVARKGSSALTAAEKITVTAGGEHSSLLKFEVLEDGAAGALKVRISGKVITDRGEVVNIENKEVTLGAADADVDLGLGGTFKIKMEGTGTNFKTGDTFVINTTGKSNDAGEVLATVSGEVDGTMVDHKFALKKDAASGKTLELVTAYLDENGDIQTKSLKLTRTNGALTAGDSVALQKLAAARSADPDSWELSEKGAGVTSATVTGMPAGTFKITSAKAAAAGNPVGKTTRVATNRAQAGMFNFTAGAENKANGEVRFEVVKKSADGTSMTLRYSGTTLGKDGQEVEVSSEVEVRKGTNTLALGLIGDVTMKIDDLAQFNEGDVQSYHFSAHAAATDEVVTVKSSLFDEERTFVFDNDTNAMKGKTFNLKFGYLMDGEVKEGTITLRTDDTTTANGSISGILKGKPASDAAGSTGVGSLAKRGTRLYDLEKFWDAQGRFMIKDPQTLTLTQGDGKQAKVTLYANDTVASMRKKLNDAIADTLGQGKYVDDRDQFVSFVEENKGNSEAAPGTFVIRTVVPGATGRISFAGDEDIIKALSLSTIQDAKESNYTVNISDAHTGATVLEDTKITGNRLIGALHPNVDVEFDAMAGVTAAWNEGTKSFESRTVNYETILHLADNTTVFQIGANEGEDMGVNIGDMRSHALGLNAVLVTDRESAARSITIIDNAIDKVSTQRAKLGAYQNRLEHTINNLTVAGENLTAAESRIRDTDMAKEMMNFTKLNIMLQAGNAMLAQANQLPQNVLSLIR